MCSDNEKEREREREGQGHGRQAYTAMAETHTESSAMDCPVSRTERTVMNSNSGTD